MRLTISALGLELDVTFGLAGTDEPEPFEPYQDAGTTGSTAMSAEHNGWERIATMYDEPSEGDEDRKRIGFGR